MAKHSFCKVYGIISFMRRPIPCGIAVIVNSINPGIISHAEIRYYDGINWEKS
jgi:hypothetical protein